MGFRFRKSFKIAPGIKVNLGKKSAGISVGNKFGGMSFNTKTGVKTRASIPGAGISYTQGGRARKHKNGAYPAPKRENTPKSNVPVPLRGWYFVIAVLCIVGGVIYCASNVPAGLLIAAVGAVMIAITILVRKKI